MVVLSTSTQEPGLAAASSLPVPTSPPPGSSYTTSGSAVQPLTIVAIVVGLVGFVLLILVGSCISRHFRQLKRVPPRPGANINSRRGFRNHNTNGSRPRLIHVEPMIATYTSPDHGSQPYDHDPSFLPPYHGPVPPPYSEALPHAPQQPCPPPRAVMEA
ncbi:hypothetical protein HD554DRAFT_1212186 [Boletus coccyginus]|nr:hypothetical protein HD554DRAFT_1212186 [Boletus coccyginus]